MAYIRKKKPFTFCFTEEGEAVFSNSISLLKVPKERLEGTEMSSLGRVFYLGQTGELNPNLFIVRLPSPKISLMEHQDNAGKSS